MMKELRRLFKHAQTKDEPYSSYSEPKEPVTVTELPQMPKLRHKSPENHEPSVISRQDLIDRGFLPENDKTIIITPDYLQRFGIGHRK